MWCIKVINTNKTNLEILQMKKDFPCCQLQPGNPVRDVKWPLCYFASCLNVLCALLTALRMSALVYVLCKKQVKHWGIFPIFYIHF